MEEKGTRGGQGQKRKKKAQPLKSPRQRENEKQKSVCLPSIDVSCVSWTRCYLLSHPTGCPVSQLLKTNYWTGRHGVTDCCAWARRARTRGEWESASVTFVIRRHSGGMLSPSISLSCLRPSGMMQAGNAAATHYNVPIPVHPRVHRKAMLVFVQFAL